MSASLYLQGDRLLVRASRRWRMGRITSSSYPFSGITMRKQLPIICLSHRSAFLGLLALSCLSGCSTPIEGPDKSIAGGLMGAAWGAGAGAVVGHQIENMPSGEGAALGAGFGLVSGAVSGAMYDSIETTQIDQERQLAGLRVQNAANAQQLVQLQGKLDRSLSSTEATIYQVFFDPDATHLHSGAISNLQKIADGLLSRNRGKTVHIIGHTDDAGNPKYNERLALSRARAVSSYLLARGLSDDEVMVDSKGANSPIATNATPTGRQLNRRVDLFVTAD
jgi:outer membrane protein OmpA-like peptidoglycan-associated protein